MELNGVIANPEVRHDFLLVFDVQDGNPNGDPDAGNMPRVDPETMHGLVTDVCIKRKIRDYVFQRKAGEEGYDIYVKHRGILANEQKKAYAGVDAQPQDAAHEGARQWMCRNLYDVRMFGAVMTTGKAPAGEGDGRQAKKWNCGQVRGPVQFTFARSVSPIAPLDVSITRVALTNAGDTRVEDAEEDVAASGQMGRKALLPYGLYVAKGFFSAKFAQDTGVRQDDLVLLWEALVKMWDLDHSAARGFMSLRGLYVFTHDSAIGSAPAHALFDRLKVALKPGVEAPRSFSDYEVDLDASNMPDGVTLTRVMG